MLNTRNLRFYGFMVTIVIFLLSVTTINAATFTVTKTADSNDGVCNTDCSLREALAAANNVGSDDIIEFDSSVFLTSQTITLNNATLEIENNGSLVINGTGAELLTINGNNTFIRVIFIADNARVTVNKLRITGGNLLGGGAGVRNHGFTVFNNVNISGNIGQSGTGGISSIREMTINDSIITNNTAANDSIGAGGIENSGRMVINNSIISNNTGRLVGGAIDNPFGTLIINNSTISGNTSKGSGGAISGATGAVTMNNTTVTNNSATDNGGGIYVTGGATYTLNHVTLSHNSSDSDNDNYGSGGGIYVYFGAVNLHNSILAKNTDNTGAWHDFNTGVSSSGYNLIGVGSTGNPTDIIGQDPLLGPLQNNGGTTFTRALLPGSPALDAGDPNNITVKDQRGISRPQDGDGNGAKRSDIGAFERYPTVDNKAPFDFEGDGKTDVGIFRSSDGSWWYSRSLGDGFSVYSFGTASDIITPGDFTGDGKADIAIFRPSTGFWFIQRSEDSSFFSFPFGATGDIPAPADYDGDGKIDAAVFRPASATWFIRRSSDFGTTIVNFGTPEDKPVPADYDGDGKDDIAIFRPSDGSWWYLQSTNSQFGVYRFGLGTDKPVEGDYTGDGKTDIAVFRPSTGEWFIQRSENGSFLSFTFGALGDIPAPGDYDGDGKYDPAVFRPSTGEWFVLRSTAGILITTFGIAGDRPIPNSFVP